MDHGPWNGIIHRVVFLVKLAPERDPFSVEQENSRLSLGRGRHLAGQADARLVSCHTSPRSALS